MPEGPSRGEGPALGSHAESANLRSQTQEEKSLSFFIFNAETSPPSSPCHPPPPLPTLLGPGHAQQEARGRQKPGQAEATWEASSTSVHSADPAWMTSSSLACGPGDKQGPTQGASSAGSSGDC